MVMGGREPEKPTREQRAVLKVDLQRPCPPLSCKDKGRRCDQRQGWVTHRLKHSSFPGRAWAQDGQRELLLEAL